MNCRFCDSKLTKVFVDLGESPPSNSFLSAVQINLPEERYPLRVHVCGKCFLVQLDEYKKATEIFSDDYPYFSSFSSSWLEHSRNYTKMMIQRFGFDPSSKIIEIASNDGYLLQYFKQLDIQVLGIEPTANTAEVAIKKGIESIIDFFGIKLATQLSAKGIKADLLLGNNVMAHVPDINDFVGGMKIILKPTGIITMEFPHLVQLIENNQFDTIYHEHFSYLSFITINKIFNAHDLELFDVEEISTHGGSLRIFAKHKEDGTKPIEKNVERLLAKEHELGLDSLSYYTRFQEKTDKVKLDFLNFLNDCKQKNKKVCAYGAAAKGNTLLNYCCVKNDLISFVVDASPHKQSKFLPGSQIPVVSELEIKKTKPDFVIILPWNIEKEIVKQLNYVNEWGAKFVIVIPNLSIK